MPTAEWPRHLVSGNPRLPFATKYCRLHINMKSALSCSILSPHPPGIAAPWSPLPLRTRPSWPAPIPTVGAACRHAASAVGGRRR